MSLFRTSFTRAVRAPAPRSLGPSSFIRSYVGKKDMSAAPGDQSIGEAANASNVGNPGSDSANEQSVKKSRGLDSESSPDTASVQKPLDNPTGAGTAQQEANTSTQDAFKQDPNAPAEQKRKNVEEQGQKPLDAADK